jgi:hypothetical protein
MIIGSVIERGISSKLTIVRREELDAKMQLSGITNF